LSLSPNLKSAMSRSKAALSASIGIVTSGLWTDLLVVAGVIRFLSAKST